MNGRLRWLRVPASAAPAGRRARTTASVPTPRDSEAFRDSQTPRECSRGVCRVMSKRFAEHRELRHDPRSEVARSELASTAAMDHRLDRLLDVELVEAGLTHGEVVADRVAAGGVDLVVEELVHTLEYLLTVIERCVARLDRRSCPTRLRSFDAPFPRVIGQ